MVRKVGGIYFVSLGPVGGSFYMSKGYKVPAKVEAFAADAAPLAALAACTTWAFVLVRALGYI